MVVPIDKKEVLELAGYLRSMATRLRNLQQISEQSSKHIDFLIQEVDSKKQGLRTGLDEIKKHVSGLKDEVVAVQKDILVMIEELKTSVKAQELERFNKRMDAWAPENLVTRREAERLIREL